MEVLGILMGLIVTHFCKSLFAGGFSDPNNNPAVLYRQVQAFTEVRDYTSAEKILLRLVKMTEKANGSDAIETLSYLRELAHLKLRQKELDSAERLLQRVLAIQEQNFGSNSCELAGTLGWFGFIEHERKNFSSAEQFLQRAVAIQEQGMPGNARELISPLESLVYLARRKGDGCLTLHMLQRLLFVRGIAFGEDELGAAGIHASMGVLLEEEGEHGKAAQSFARAAEIRKKHDMDKDLARYVFLHFRDLMTLAERLEYRFVSQEDFPKHRPQSPAEEEALRRANDRFSFFIERTGERILAECRNRVFLNRCPRCGRVARTPTAKQCRYCRHDWHANRAR